MPTIYVSDKDRLPDRHQNDHYATERTLIAAALQPASDPAFRSFLDPACADGRWGQVAKNLLPGLHVVGVDVDSRWSQPADYTEFHNRDFLDPALTFDRQFDLIATNPPYGPKWSGKKKVREIFNRYGFAGSNGITRVTTAELFIRRSLELLAPRGRLLMLLELQFVASLDCYNGLFQTHPLHRLRVCSRRPSFYGGGTNGTDFAIFEWHKDSQGRLVGEAHRWSTELFYYERDYDR